MVGGAQRSCNCKRSQCLKKYCECFQAGLVCLDECKCQSCKNFEGSELRRQALAGEGITPRNELSDDGEEHLDADRALRRRKRRGASQEGEGSDGEGKWPEEEGYGKGPLRPPQPHQHQHQQGGDSALSLYSHPHPFGHAPQKPSALPIRVPGANGRSFRNQLVRLDVCSFVGTSLQSFCKVLLAGAETGERQTTLQDNAGGGGGGIENAAVTQHVHVQNADSEYLRANESMPESNSTAVQERVMLEETANFLKRILEAATSSLDSASIVTY